MQQLSLDYSTKNLADVDLNRQINIKNSDKFKNLNFLDLCSGIGSAHLAFKNLSLNCIGYSEIDKRAEETYNLFFGDKYKNYGDLMHIDPSTLIDFDILTAGFPCQPFSIVGNRKGIDDERGKIIYGIANILKYKQPKGFLLENVKGLVNLNKGSALKEILSLLKNSGYTVYWKILESTDFGIPQARQRIYFVGIRNDLHKNNFFFPEKNKQQVSLSDFLIDDDENFILNKSSFSTFQRYLENKYNKGKYNINKLLQNDYLVLDTRQSDLRLFYNKIPTLRTGRQGIFYTKNQQIRKLSGLEALLLQGFSFDMAKYAQEKFSQTTILAQAGNAMTVNVMEEIGKNILNYFYE